MDGVFGIAVGGIRQQVDLLARAAEGINAGFAEVAGASELEPVASEGFAAPAAGAVLDLTEAIVTLGLALRGAQLNAAVIRTATDAYNAVTDLFRS
jgi:hypothetical protein